MPPNAVRNGYGKTSDGWRNYQSKPLISIINQTVNGTVAVTKVIDTSGLTKTKEWMADVLITECEDDRLGPPLTIALDGACRSSFAQIELALIAKAPHNRITCQH